MLAGNGDGFVKRSLRRDDLPIMRLTDPFENDLPGKLKSARQASGLSTRDVAERIKARFPISHATIANYESGRTQPNLGVLLALAEVYGRAVQWFMERTPSMTNIRYRHYKSKVTKAEKQRYEAEATRWLEAYLRIEHRLNAPLRPVVKCPARPKKATPEAYARMVREALELGELDPIQSVVTQMERCGIRVIEVTGPEGIDGLAARFGEDSVVVLNPACSNDRMRLNESHEFFHELLGHCGEAGPGGTDDEDDAFACARAFLLPAAQLHEAFAGESFVKLVKFKEMFGISLGAMIYAAEQDGCLSAAKARRLWIELSRRGWRANEPGNVRPDRATRFEQILDGAINSGTLDWREASIVAGIPAEQLEERVRLAMGIDSKPEQRQERGGEPTLKGLRLAE